MGVKSVWGKVGRNLGFVYTDVIQYRGNHYDFGVFQGEQLKKSPILIHRKKQWWPKRERHFLIDVEQYINVMKIFAPKILEEVIGLRDALEISLEESFILFGGYYLEFGNSGCSIVTGDKYFIRNYDNEPQTYEGRLVLFQPIDEGYASIGPSMQITGRTDGMNEKGLSIGYNFVNRLHTKDGFVCNMIARIVLEQCSTVEEAIALLKEIPHRHAFNYVLKGRNEETWIVEASPRDVIARKGFYCTNHFSILENENRYRIDDSKRREGIIASFQENNPDAFRAFQKMNDPNDGIFSTKYGAWAGTIHTAAYFPHELKNWYSIGGNQLPVIIDFNQWIQGTDTVIRRIKGYLESTSNFINME